MLRRILAFTALIGLCACGAETGLIFAGANVASLVSSDKLIPDHVASWATDQDCSLVRVSRGEGYCKPKTASPANAGAGPGSNGGPHCYRTLARIDCYREPDPRASDLVSVP